MFLFKAAILIALSSYVANIEGAKKCKTDKANVKIFNCKDLPKKFGGKKISQKAADALVKNGYTKCVLPFGVLVVGDGKFADAGILKTAKLVAELADANKDGVADVPTMIAKLRNKAWLLCGKTKAGADKLAAALSGQTFIPGSTFFEVDRFWHMQGGLTKVHQDRIRVEEVFHMFTQWGYGLEWPKQFGTAKGTDWNESTLTKECRKAKCVWWQHPENNCPDQLAGSDYKQAKCTNKDKCVGQCAETNCDCVEWYHQVVVTAMGGTPAWRSNIRDSLGSAKTMPKTAAGMDEILSTEMIDLLYDTKYHQPISPITGAYPEVGKC